MPSSVALLDNKKIVSAVNEERYTRIKNDEIFPAHSIDFCLKESNISASDLDAVAIASFDANFDQNLVHLSRWTVHDYLKEQYKRWKPFLIDKTDKEILPLSKLFPHKVNLDQYPTKYWRETYKKQNREKIHNIEREKIVADYLGIAPNKVKRIDHHKCHAFYSYYSSNMIGKKVLALTVDAMGDGMNATINTFDENGKFKRHYHTDQCAIARIYRYMTLLLGMKPNEHEYKLMGLAPYGKKKYSEGAFNVFEETLKVSGTDFVWNIKPSDSFFWFKEKLEGYRFDSIAYALQRWTENLLIEWTKNCVQKFGITNVVYSGGVAMNIKAMGKIAELDCVENFFVGGSASDESMAVSAGLCLDQDILDKKNIKWKSIDYPRIKTLYLGPKSNKSEEKELLTKIESLNYNIETDTNPKVIADYLYKGFIVGRCVGRMEFGQRALGNRSILADPRNILTKEKINNAIKNRDFWMPFAPIVLDKAAETYLINPKKIQSPHMTIGFNTTKIGYDKMIAACHQADKTARAQILEKSDNPILYNIIEEFYNLTGCMAVLNTSFNLHGYPIVNSPKDAFFVFENSGLDILVLNNYIIKKKLNKTTNS